MKCKFCDAEISDGSLFCNVCGKRLDGKIQCSKCGKFSDDGNFCSFCGARLKNEFTCGRCGTIFEGKFCPTCGFAIDSTFVKALSGEETSLTDSETNAGEAVAESKVKKALPLIFSVIGLVGVLLIFALTFLTGMKDTFINFGAKSTATQYIYYFFGDVYSDLTESYGSGYASLGTVVSAALLVTMTILTIVSVYKFVTSYKAKDYKPFIKYALLTYVLYVALIFMYRSIASSYYSDYSITYGVNTFDFSIKYSLNGAGIAALVSGGVLVFSCFLGNIITTQFKPERGTIAKRYVLSGLAVVFIFISVCVLSGLVARFKELFRTTMMNSDTFERYPFARWGYETGDGSVFAYGFISQLATFAFILFGMLMVFKILMYIFNKEPETRLKLFSVISAVSIIVMFVFALIMQNYMVKNQVDVFGFTNQTNYPRFYNLYIGLGFFIVGFVIYVIHTKQSKNVSSAVALEEAVVPVNNITIETEQKPESEVPQEENNFDESSDVIL